MERIKSLITLLLLVISLNLNAVSINSYKQNTNDTHFKQIKEQVLKFFNTDLQNYLFSNFKQLKIYIQK